MFSPFQSYWSVFFQSLSFCISQLPPHKCCITNHPKAQRLLIISICSQVHGSASWPRFGWCGMDVAEWFCFRLWVVWLWLQAAGWALFCFTCFSSKGQRGSSYGGSPEHHTPSQVRFVPMYLTEALWWPSWTPVGQGSAYYPPGRAGEVNVG